MKLKYRIKILKVQWAKKKEEKAERERINRKRSIKEEFYENCIARIIVNKENGAYLFVMPNDSLVVEKALKGFGVGYKREEMCERDPKHREIRFEIIL